MFSFRFDFSVVMFVNWMCFCGVMVAIWLVFDHYVLHFGWALVGSCLYVWVCFCCVRFILLLGFNCDYVYIFVGCWFGYVYIWVGFGELCVCFLVVLKFVMFLCWVCFVRLGLYFVWVLMVVMFVCWLGFVRHVCILVMF